MPAPVLNSVLPVCLLVLLGAALRHGRFLPEVFFAQLNRLGFWLLLPSLLFSTLADASSQSGGQSLRIALLLCAGAVGVILAGATVSRLLRLPEPSSRALIQAAMRGNLAYTALPVLLYAYGENSEAAVTATLALAPTIPFYNFCAVLILTPKAGGTRRSRCLRAAAAILRNPLILGCGAGLAVLWSGLRPPVACLRTIEALGRAALPCALISLGAGLTLSALRTRGRAATAATALKLLAAPAIGWVLAPAFGVHGDARVIALLYLATPCAVTSYVMADQMGADRELAAAAIALSTLLCMPVMIFLLFCLR
ncbi:MAG: AEC family transporter [Kiritimatiellia bacterium]|jgi:predicted permease|nr:AEC family transporter [Kiritimatiellia bacterium]